MHEQASAHTDAWIDLDHLGCRQKREYRADISPADPIQGFDSRACRTAKTAIRLLWYSDQEETGQSGHSHLRLPDQGVPNARHGSDHEDRLQGSLHCALPGHAGQSFPRVPPLEQEGEVSSTGLLESLVHDWVLLHDFGLVSIWKEGPLKAV